MLLPVQPEEEAMIRTLCGERHHMGLSRGLVRNGSFRAVNGPLAGKEALIRKLDLHKRIAVLNLKPVKENKDIWRELRFCPENRIRQNYAVFIKLVGHMKTR